MLASQSHTRMKYGIYNIRSDMSVGSVYIGCRNNMHAHCGNEDIHLLEVIDLIGGGRGVHADDLQL